MGKLQGFGEPKFKKGDTVRLKRETAQRGVVVAEPRCINGKFSYRVNMGGRTRNFSEEDLELCGASEAPRDLFIEGSFGDRESCLLYLTYLRITGGLSNYVYSFYNSRTQFYIHQFKPLIKFLDSDHGRILLADEVGLGKTIEAGFIVLEMLARQEFSRALVLCPAKLRGKWRREMLSRFDLDFAIESSRGLLRILREAERNPHTAFQAIVSYETVRREQVREALSQSGLDLDIVIADEAHRMRNSATYQHVAGAILADLTSRMLLLTATPVNNRSEDLFNLLRLLDAERFSDYYFFDTIRDVNARVVDLERVIRRGLPVHRQEALALMEELEQSHLGEVFAGNYFFERLKSMVRESAIQTQADLIEAQRLVAKVNLLSGHLARTRRRDVDEKRPVRSAHLWALEPTPEETQLYQAVYKYMMRYYADFRLPVMNMERILASCMPAFIEHYSAVLREGARADAWDDEDATSGGDNGQQDGDDVPMSGLETVLQIYGRPIIDQSIDTKFDSLLEIMRELDRTDPECKIIIFSYFRRTIAYLDRRLREAGYSSVVVHGGVPTCPEEPELDEREIRRRLFQEDPSIRVMISSEVGGEGLDFQFSHIVINYDLPWNPMRVEQRIGRIDRIGQRSDRLLIYSLVLKGTVDELIYRRLLSKIGIFEQCIGDLESVLGNEIRSVVEAMFDPSLTQDEKEQRAEEAAVVLQRRLAEAEELERDCSKVIGTDQYIKEEIERILSSRRYVGPDEVRLLVHRVFALPQLGLNVEETAPGVYSARLTGAARSFFDGYMDRSRSADLFRARLRAKRMSWTFDFETASANPQLELLNLRHPAVRAISEFLERDASQLVATFRVTIPQDRSDSVHAGTYALGVLFAEYGGVRLRRELVSLACDLESGDMLDERASGSILSRIITDSHDVDLDIGMSEEARKRACDAIENRAVAVFERRREEIAGEENAFLTQRRRQIQDQTARKREAEERRRQALTQRLAQAAAAGRQRDVQRLENLLRGRRTRIENLEEQCRARLAELPEAAEVSLAWELRCIGLVVIEE